MGLARHGKHVKGNHIEQTLPPPTQCATLDENFVFIVEQIWLELTYSSFGCYLFCSR